jgi:hypothetical protein
MRLRLMTASPALARSGPATPDTGPLSGVLLRPFLDLTGDGGPINARIAAYAGRSLSAAEDAADWLPPQSNTKAMLRAALIRETGLFDYAITWPAELPEHLITEPWGLLRDEVGQSDALDSARRYRLVCVLYKLGLFRAAIQVAGIAGPDQVAADDFAGLTMLRAASAMSKSGHSTHSVAHYSARVFDHAPRGSRARLAAAINLAIHFARATRETDQTAAWAGRIHTEMATLRPALRPADVLMTSVALRAASFGPFVRRDRAAVTKALDDAEEYARAALRLDEVPRVLAEENLYAVLETRTNEAVASRDRAAALLHSSALVEHDPMEPKAWLQLGAVHWDDHRVAESLAAYRTAAVLGAPFTAASWYCIGRCLEELGELEEACHAYGVSVTAEPLGITSLLGLHRVATRTSQPAVASWAAGLLQQLRQRRAGSAPATDPDAPRWAQAEDAG